MRAQFCWWGGEQLKQLLEQQEYALEAAGLRPQCASFTQMANKACYNELVVGSEVWVAKLPAIVEAIEFPARASHEVEARARKVHAAFVESFGTERPCPLVSYDASNLDAPFALAG